MRDLIAAAEKTSVAVSLAAADTPDAPLIYVNEPFCALTGYRPEDVLGRDCRLLQCEDSEPEARLKMRTALDTRTGTSVIIRNRRRDGSQFRNFVNLAPLRAGDGKWYVLGCQFCVSDAVAFNDLSRHVDGVNVITGAFPRRTPSRIQLDAVMMRVESVRMLVDTESILSRVHDSGKRATRQRSLRPGASSTP